MLEHLAFLSGRRGKRPFLFAAFLGELFLETDGWLIYRFMLQSFFFLRFFLCIAGRSVTGQKAVYYACLVTVPLEWSHRGGQENPQMRFVGIP